MSDRVDIADIERLAAEFDRAVTVGFRRVLLKGEALLVEEVPVDSGDMRSGVGSEFFEDDFRGEIYVAAQRPARGPRQAVLHKKGGETRPVQLRGTKQFLYPETVAKGKPAQLAPRSAKAFLVQVKGTPSGAYISVDGKNYVVRKRIKAVPANPYDDRAGTRLEALIEPIFDKALLTVTG